MTSISAILLCCSLAAIKPLKWHLAGFAAVAAIFFFFVFADTGTLNKMENQAERYERVLPAGQQIVATIFPFVGSRMNINHIVDRACVGQCFSYGNYEPSSNQFRIRALPGNRIVATNAISVDQIESGRYVVQPQDPPLFQIYQCDQTLTRLCMRDLVAGEKNGSIGVQPVH
jgi:hypothetical protein